VLAKELQKIYEDKYGPIQTSHVQKNEQPVVKHSSPGREISPAASVPDQQLPTSPPPTEQTTLQQSTQQPEPASTLTTPTSSQTATYTILSYDSKTKSMTKASFDSIPSQSESIIPLTVALRHLNCAEKFLPKLKSLREAGFVPVHVDRNLLMLRKEAPSGIAGGATEAFQFDEEPVQHESLAEKSMPKQRRKLEPVFSGGKRTGNSHAQFWRELPRNREEEGGRSREEGERMDRGARRAMRSFRRKRRFARVIFYTTSGILVLGTATYIAGVGAEVNRGRKVVVGKESLE